jgi:glycine/D-amino acid oxidase-like deaminating enzyme
VTDWDLVVVGAGTAGIPCAVEASRRGARVLLLEKQTDVGGTLHVSGGHLSAGGARRQREHGISDSPEAHLADVRRIAHGTGRADLMELATKLAPATVDWLADCGFEFDPASPRIVYGHEPYSTPRTFYGPEGGRSILAVLRRLLSGSKVDLRLGTRVEKLLTEEGRVTGVQTSAGEAFRTRVVILTTGGYGANPYLFQELDGRPLFTSAVPGSTGDGLLMARAVGAGIQGSGTFIPTFGGLTEADDEHRVLWDERPVLVAAERPPWEVYVDRRGKRFVAEDEPSIDVKERKLAQLPDLTFWVVFDTRGLENGAPIVKRWSIDELRAMANRRPGISSAPTLRELAEKSGIDPDGLKVEIDAYNAGLERGHDAMGRTFLPAPIADPPFLAIRNHGVTLITFCGLDVDGELRVRDTDGNAIEGLYAAGEVVGAGATSGNAFCGGMLVTPAISFGRWLGARVAENAVRLGA